MRKVLSSIADAVGADEIQIAVGLLLIAVGCWHAWRPAAFLIPGAVLVWMALPPRRPFVAHDTSPETPKRRLR